MMEADGTAQKGHPKKSWWHGDMKVMVCSIGCTSPKPVNKFKMGQPAANPCLL